MVKSGDIKLAEFLKHFKGLTGSLDSNTGQSAEGNDTEGNVTEGNDNDSVYTELDVDFTLEEIAQGITKLARHKSAGIDSVTLNEYFIEFRNIFSPLLVKLFNTIN